jgi:hypothetical protein
MQRVNADIAKQHPGINKQYGKGSKSRTVPDNNYRDNYDDIFGGAKNKKVKK